MSEARLPLASRGAAPLSRSDGAAATDVHASASTSTAPASVRAFARQDIPAVCRLFFNTFRPGKNPDIGDLDACLEAIYLSSPSYSPATGSVVHVNDDGRIDGFLGVINLSLTIGQRPLRAGVLSAFMAESPLDNPQIGPRLVRSVAASPLDVIFTDTANNTSLEISRAMRFNLVPMQSLEWTKILRPAGTGAYVLAKRAARLARPLNAVATLADALLPNVLAPEVNPRTVKGLVDRALEMTAFVTRAPAFVEPFRLRPSWGRDELTWLVEQASLRTKNGPLHIREVLDSNDRCLGLYLLYARKGGVAYALQILAQPGREDMVVGSLISQAKALGAVSVQGPASAPIVSGLLRQKGVFYRQVMSMIVRSADPDVIQALRTGDVCLGGLAGETWARVFGDQFR